MNKEDKLIGKKVLIKKGSLHPHAGEEGEVLDFKSVHGLRQKAYLIKGEFCDFYVFNKEHLKIK